MFNFRIRGENAETDREREKDKERDKNVKMKYQAFLGMCLLLLSCMAPSLLKFSLKKKVLRSKQKVGIGYVVK